MFRGEELLLVDELLVVVDELEEEDEGDVVTPVALAELDDVVVLVVVDCVVVDVDDAGFTVAR